MQNHGSFFGRRARQAAACAFLLLTLAAYAHVRRHEPTAVSITGTPATSDQTGSPYSFVPTASGPRNRTLTFSVVGRPSWATFNSATGQLSGTPASSASGTYPNIAISVTDGSASASLPPFTITVTAPPSAAPTIAGTPATSVAAGSAYSFTPLTTDPSSAALSFTVQNLPGWATFNASTGNLAGTPQATAAGTYSNIVISVSAGTSAPVSLAPFAITVTQSSTGTATLSWTQTMQNTNGSTLTNLAGYRIYYGTSPSNLSQVIQLTGTGLTTYVISNLSSATWYFGMTAYDSAGIESALSNLGSKAIP
jgi:Putative Ig domain